MTNHTIVIGAGAIGACSALGLVRTGRQVTVLDRATGWGQGCSAGNAGLVCASHYGRWAHRRDIVHALRWLSQRDGAMRVRPTPAVTAFLTRAMTLTPTRAREADRVSQRLCERSLEAHHRLLDEGINWKPSWDGLFDVFRTREALTSAAQRIRPQDMVLTGDEARSWEPAVGPEVLGVLFRVGDGFGDPARFVAEVGALATAAGVICCPATTVTGIRREHGRLSVHLITRDGTSTQISADHVLIAAGAATVGLSRGTVSAGILQGGRGQSIDLDSANRPCPSRPLILREDRVALTPLPGRLRVAGRMDFGGGDTVDLGRLDALRQQAELALPGWSQAAATPGWAGARPCTPDGNPLLGWLDSEHTIAVATGHGMLGLTLAPVTADMVVSLFSGRADADLCVLDPHRFRR
ncbi:D-amino acid dehydrogenase 1 [Austwickia sp. TVS 96-490-7B]|uniref:NAD(P)/FAD-dependent oxidoreductase n=1 Tax=Austwickia sp. TVS 96-490-7B TaxID=2830843 RepID=UPI001C5912AA|nr:FAD-dependent oxidoreductase [Austwickia sp. TVS 96-490-7B]MBW3087078.1 D-amino acid dehydrogenase 1 [Austwickia sp. TVS 96-490-7B]